MALTPNRTAVTKNTRATTTRVVYGTTGFGVVAGDVVDRDGTPLAGVTITATSPSMLGAKAELTDASGQYRLESLPQGTYDLIAFYADVQITQSNVAVGHDHGTRVDFALAPNAASTLAHRKVVQYSLMEAILRGCACYLPSCECYAVGCRRSTARCTGPAHDPIDAVPGRARVVVSSSFPHRVEVASQRYGALRPLLARCSPGTLLAARNVCRGP